MTCTALILAAGVGSRLMPLTRDQPKALVDVAGQSMLERLLTACAEAGLSNALVVTGYRHEAIEAWLASRDLALTVDTVFNDCFETRGNAWSVGVAADALAGQTFVKLDGDLVVGATVLRQLLDHPAPSAICVDTRAALDAEAMKAALDDGGWVSALGKGLDPSRAAGEFIGAEKIAAADAPALFAAIDELVCQEGFADAYYEDVYHALIQRGWRLGALDVGGADWAEIDDQADLERASELLTRRQQAAEPEPHSEV